MHTPPRAVVVENDRAIRETLAAALSEDGLTVETAASSAAALAVCAEEPPDLVTLDLDLPGGEDGLWLGRTLRQQYGMGLPIIVVSGSASISRVAEELGAYACLAKPFELNELLTTVDQALDWP